MPSLLTLLAACSDTEKHSQDKDFDFMPESATTPDPDEPFYPYADYILNQLAYIDTTPFAIEKTVSIDGVLKDSSFVQKDELNRMAGQFTDIDPNHPDIKAMYRESSFQDLTINRLTFSIVAQVDSLPLQQADILLNPENQSIKNVILRKQWSRGDSSVSQHLLWVHNMHFQISEMISHNNGKNYTRVIRIVWDKPLE
jgi:hypothetical protein